MTLARTASIAVLLALLCACVSERSRRLGTLEPWPPRSLAAPTQSVALRLYGNLLLDGTPSDLPSSELVLWREEALRAYRESGLFTSAEAGWGEGDCIAEVGFVIRKKSPGQRELDLGGGEVQTAQSELILRTRFRDRSGRSLGSVEVSEMLRSYSPIPYVGGYLPNRLQDDVVYDLYRATLLRAVQRGILKKPTRG